MPYDRYCLHGYVIDGKSHRLKSHTNPDDFPVAAHHLNGLLQTNIGACTVYHQTDAVTSSAYLLAALHHILCGTVHHFRSSQLPGYPEPYLYIFLQSNHHNIKGPHYLCYLHGEEAQRPCTEYNHILSRQEAGTLGNGLIRITDGIHHSRFLIFKSFRNLPDGSLVNGKYLPRNSAVLCKTAAVSIPQAQIDLL